MYGKVVWGLGGTASWVWGGVRQTPHVCPPRARRVQRPPRKWEVRAAPPLPWKLAGGEEGMAPRPDHFPTGNTIRHAYQMGGFSQSDYEGRLSYK